MRLVLPRLLPRLRWISFARDVDERLGTAGEDHLATGDREDLDAGGALGAESEEEAALEVEESLSLARSDVCSSSSSGGGSDDASDADVLVEEEEGSEAEGGRRVARRRA